jgi:trehalose-phosphatase
MSQPLFEDIHEVEHRLQVATHVLLCLDYDGTLTHFAATPLGAHLSPQMERILLLLAEHEDVTLAIVSGRDRTDLQGRIGLPGVLYAGNHGLEISGPGLLFVEPTAAEQSGPLHDLADQIAARLQPITGALVEYKGLTLSVHYRQVHQEQWEEVRKQVHGALAGAAHPFVLNTGEKVFEIRPRVYWNKANAVLWIKEKIGKPGTAVIYIGDDTTDEDAFVGLPDAITVRVGHPPATAARYHLECSTEVRKFLEWLEELLRIRSTHHIEAAGNNVV